MKKKLFVFAFCLFIQISTSQAKNPPLPEIAYPGNIYILLTIIL